MVCVVQQKKEYSISEMDSKTQKKKQHPVCYTHHRCVILLHSAQQTSYAQLLITGLFSLTKTIKCSTLKWRLPQADLGEDHPFTIELLQRAEYYTREPGEGLRKCPCIPTGCHGGLRLGHRGREQEEKCGGGRWSSRRTAVLNNLTWLAVQYVPHTIIHT